MRIAVASGREMNNRALSAAAELADFDRYRAASAALGVVNVGASVLPREWPCPEQKNLNTKQQ
ncbi:MAG: hypothetical protein WA417_10395 [Stellaceae bacterium]